MAKKERIEAEVDIKTKGLSKAQSGIQKLRANWLDFAGDLAEPMLLLATGATKAQALWGGLQGVFMTRVLGPMGMVAGASAALLAVTGKIVKAWKDVGMAGAAGLSKMALEFRPLLGSIDLARQRVTELYKFTANTPFRLGGVVKANKILQSLTGGMLATEKGMELVGDSAAVAGVGIDETARSVGRLYDGLMSGRPVGEASMRLQEMGLVSGTTRNAIESMQAANISGMKIWQMVERELGRNKGAMKDLSQELEGLQSTLDDTKSIAQASFSKGFLKGEKETVRALTKAWESMTPVLEYLGRQLGTISNALQSFKAKVATVVTSSGALVNIMKLAANVFLVFNAAVLIAAGAALGKFLVSVLRVASATKAQIATMAADTANKVVNQKVTESLSVAQVRLAAAYNAAKTGAFGSAAANLKLAAANTLTAARTNLASTATLVFAGALKVLGLAARFVVKSLVAMAVALVANPIMATVTAVLALGAVLLHLKNKWDDAAKAIESYRRASDAVVSSLKAQRTAIQTVNDMRKTEARMLGELTKAYREQAVAAREGNVMMQNVADNKIIAIQAELKALRELNAERLRRTDEDAQQEERDYQDSKVIEQMEEDRELQQADDDERVVIAKEQAEEKRRKFNAARQDMDAEKRTAAEVRKLGQKDQERKAKLEAEIAEMEGEYASRDEENRNGGSHDNKVARDKVGRQLKEKRKELAELEAETGLAAQTEVGAQSDSEIARLKARINLYTTLKEAQQELSSANQALAEAQGGDSEADGFEDKLNAARSRASKAQADLDALQQVRDRLANPFDDSAGQSAAEVDLKDKLASIEEQEAVINLALNDQATDVLEQKQAAIRDKKAAIQLKLETENLDAVESGKLKDELDKLEGQEMLINLMVEDDATEEIRAKHTELQGLIAEVELKLESGDLSEVESGQLQDKLNSLNGQLAVVELALQDDASSKLQAAQAAIEDKKAKLVLELEDIPESEKDQIKGLEADLESLGDARAILELALEDNATEKLKERQDQVKDRKAAVELALEKDDLAPLERGELEAELKRLTGQERSISIVAGLQGREEVVGLLDKLDNQTAELSVEVAGKDGLFDLKADLDAMEDEKRIMSLALEGDDDAESRLGEISEDLDAEEKQIKLMMSQEGVDEATLDKLQGKLDDVSGQKALVEVALSGQSSVDELLAKQQEIQDREAEVRLKLEKDGLDPLESGELERQLSDIEAQKTLISLMVKDDATENVRAKYDELQGLIAEVELKLESGDLSEVESGQLQDKLNSLNGQLAVVELVLQDDASGKLQSIQAGIEDKKAKLVVELENIPEKEIDQLQMDYAEVERAGDAKAVLEMALEDNATEKLKERQEQIKDRKAVVELALDKEGLAPLEKGELEKELQRLQYQDRIVRVVTEEMGLDEIREDLEYHDGKIIGLGVEVLGRDKVFDLRSELDDMEDKERIVRLALQGDDEAKSRLGSIKDNLDIEEAQIRLSMTKEGLDEATLEKLQRKLDDVNGQRVLVDVALAGGGGVDDLLAKQQEIRDKKAAIKLELEKDGLDPLESGELQDKLNALEQQEALIELAIEPGNEKKLKDKLTKLEKEKVKVVTELEDIESSDSLITDERGLEDAENKLKRKQEERSSDAVESEVIASENKAEDIDRERSQQLDRSKLDAEERVSQLKLEGLAAEEKALDIAYEKLQLAIEQKKISGAEAEDARRVLDARKEALALKAQEAKETLKNKMEGKQGALQERIARADGDLEGVKKAREKQDKAEDAEKEKALRKEAEQISSDPVEIERIVKEGMEVFRGEREFARKQQEEDELLQRRRSRGDMNQAEANITAEMFKQSGKTKEGKAFQEQEQRKLDDVKRDEAKKKFIDQGFSAEEAGSMADREVKVSQAQRAMDMLKEQGTGQVVASSLAKIGGGGGVSGTDPNTKILEKMEQILRDIRDQDKENVVNVF